MLPPKQRRADRPPQARCAIEGRPKPQTGREAFSASRRLRVGLMLGRIHVIAFLVLLAASGCRRAPPPPPDNPPDERIAQPTQRAGRFLIDQQSADGSWRSDVYGQFKDGTALTPLVLQALLRLSASPARDGALSKGADFLAGLIQPDGAIASQADLPYSLYTATGAVEVLSRFQPDRRRAARDRWLTWLRGRQLNEKLGWERPDWQYGGWGYCPVVPRKPKPGEFSLPLLESNLSATVFAVSALRAGGVPESDPAYREALVFVESCQNFASGKKQAFDDGGFFFVHGDSVRNKAGVAGRDDRGRERYRSYGSTTADGLRALRLCGLAKDHPRVVAARDWLTAHFTSERDPVRESAYFYQASSITKAFTDVGVEEVDGPDGKLPWRKFLTDELLTRQRNDGSWKNSILLVREDDPLVATAFAVLALADLEGTDGR
jgi:hypothetical protein